MGTDHDLCIPVQSASEKVSGYRIQLTYVSAPLTHTKPRLDVDPRARGAILRHSPLAV